MRKTFEELEAIKKKLNCHTLYSWSRYKTYKTCNYEYFLKYVKRVKEDRHDSIYGISGNVCHNVLEKFYGKEIEYDQMLDAYENELLTMNLADLKYDRTDEEKNKKIAEKYEACIRHFFQHHQIINKKVEIERFITVKVGSFYLQGYVDFMFKEGNKFQILDWKTSTIYTGKKILAEQGQLVLYSEALRQLGVPLENIVAKWCFLKYLTVEVPQANGKIAVRNIERNDIGNSLASNLKMWLKKAKYSEDDIDSYISTVILTNSLDCLPDDIKSKYKISDCFVEIELSEEIIDDLKKDIVETLIEINKKEMEYLKTEDENVFWSDVTNENSYYFATLSGYSANLHKPYKEYLDARDMFKNKKEKETDEDDDLSWLNEL
jgi:RecB family exonuclease